jgi:hypothetical protein
MQGSPEDNRTSWVEDLDPEPTRREGLGQWRELILGLVLLVAVVGWAGWQWWAQARNESEYSLGEQAMQTNNLEEAETHFASIAGYRDAGSRAEEIGRTIAERDADYRDLATSYQSGDWLRAYDAAWKLKTIVPGDSYPQSLFDGAREHIYTEALSGTVFSRMDASLPGLYYRDGDQWIWFDGSDIRSRVLGFGPPGHMVYDVPGTNRARTFNIDPSYWLDGSKLMLATFAPDGVKFEPLSLDPAAFDYFIWGENGVWGLKAKTPGSNVRLYGMHTDYMGYDITYEAYGSPITSDMKPKGPAWIVLDFAPDGTQILLADVGNYSIGHPLTNLYLADADGTNTRLLYSYIGNFQRALFSPNSRYVLVTLYSQFPYDTKAGRQSIILFDTAGQQAPRVLAQADRSYDSTTYYLVDILASTFLQSGPYAGQVLLVDSAANQTTTISMVDPGDVPQTIPKWTLQADVRQTGNNWWGEVENDKGLQLVFQGTPDKGPPYLIFAWDHKYSGREYDYPGSGLTLDWARVDLSQGENLQGAWLSTGGNLVYVVTKLSPADPASQRKITVYPNTLLWGVPIKPQVLTKITYFRLDYPYNGYDPGQFASGPLSWSSAVVAGPGLLVYGMPERGDFGQLQVKSYDGNSTVDLADKGYKLYNWSQYKIFRGLR